MSREEAFDAFYRDARDRLLVQTFALTGDARVARSAVRDTFVEAWHHWRKVSRRADPEDWARPHAWQHAHRRHATRPWHREKGLEPDVAATIEALGRLSHAQRRVLLLTHLASVSLEDMAHEVGLTVEDTTRELQTATSQLAVHREVPTTSVPLLLRGLFDTTLDGRWPRASIIRRAGATRRRTHTLLGAVAAVAAVAVTGTLVADPAGVRPTLDRDPVAVAASPRPAPSGAPAETDVLPSSAMLPATRVAALLPGRGWEEKRTHDNTHGDGLVVPCQQARYADPRLVDALVREIRTPRDSEPRRAVVATTEASRNEAAARRAMGRLGEWFARCEGGARTQLLGTSTVEGVGEEAVQVVLRDWGEPVTTTVVGMARSGRFVVTTASSVRSARVEVPPLQAQLLATAVAGVCDLEGGGGCPDDGRAPTLRPRDALPAGDPATMLVETDLPPVSGVDAPWVGTSPERARGDNAAATRCDRTSFAGQVGGKPVRDATTRTFLIPEAELPVEFGLTETVGRLPAPQARAFVSAVRRKMATCADRDLGTDVLTAASRAGKAEELAVWHVTVEVSETRSVKYFMAVARTGGRVLQLGFIPAPASRWTAAPSWPWPSAASSGCAAAPGAPDPRSPGSSPWPSGLRRKKSAAGCNRPAPRGVHTARTATRPPRNESRTMDEVEFDDFYTTSYSRVVGQVYAMIGSRDEAEECVQEAFVRAWAHRRSLDRSGHPEAWVRTTAYRLAVSRWRRVVKGRRPTDRALGAPVTSAAPSEAHVALVAALKQLPEAQRRAVVLHHLADLPVHEVARETGVPEGTVKARLSRGRAALAALLTDSTPDTLQGGATSV